MKKKIYVCPNCGRALNFSEDRDYTFYCGDCGDYFHEYEAKTEEQARMEGVKDYTELAKASMEIKAITEKAITDSNRQITIKGKSIVEQISEYISETVKPILDTGIYNDRKFVDCARIYTRHFNIRFGDYCVASGCQVQLWGENGALCVYFRKDGKYFIEDRGDKALPWLVEEWSKLKDSMNRMIPYALNECNKENQRKLAQQEELSKVIDSFRL